MTCPYSIKLECVINITSFILLTCYSNVLGVLLSFQFYIKEGLLHVFPKCVEKFRDSVIGHIF